MKIRFLVLYIWFNLACRKFTKDLQTIFKKAANLFISCTDEEDMQASLDNLSSLLVLMDSQPAMIDLYNWLHISGRFYDYMRHLKTKSTVYTISQRNSETVQMFIVFPFKYFSELDIQEVKRFLLNLIWNLF